MRVIPLCVLLSLHIHNSNTFWWSKNQEPGGLYISEITFTTVGRWSFEGIDYDATDPDQTYVAPQTFIHSANGTCMNDYIDCTLRQPYATIVCAHNYYLKNFADYYSICEVEYNNCKTERIYKAYYSSIFYRLWWPWSHQYNGRWLSGDGPNCYEDTYYGDTYKGYIQFSADNYSYPNIRFLNKYYLPNLSKFPKWFKYDP